MASWKLGLSRYLPALRFFGCPESPSSRGVMHWYCRNYHELKLLNPNLPLMLRTMENAMPAVTTELEWTKFDLLRFMIQTGRFRDTNGSIAQDRVEAAQVYLNHDWDKMAIERWKSPSFDPERPGLDEEEPEWKENAKITSNLATYFGMKQTIKDAEATFTGGPNHEYTRAENALLMAQRVDLWCAGPKEVERAVVHLYKLGRALNEREVDAPDFVTEFLPSAHDLYDA